MNRTAPKWLRVLAWSGMAIWAATITVLSSMTPQQIEGVAPFEIWDKAAHFSAFLAGGVNLTLAFGWSTGWSWRRVVLSTLLALSLFGAVDEIHQLFTPNRSGADPLDWTADMLGSLSGALLTALLYARYFSPPRPAPAGA